MPTLKAFSDKEAQMAKVFLATQVASMMGRKLEEGDWTKVYCQAKNIPESTWSNLHVDVNYDGLGLEIKLLRIAQLRDRPIKTVCGTTLMHPAATRSIRIDDLNAEPNAVMYDVFSQYAELIRQRTERVRSTAPEKTPDMRTGWLIWEDNLTEFLYFEEKTIPPNPKDYYAQWNETAARGARKPSKSLWIYQKQTNQKRYSVTTSAGIKIQPYFDVPSPSDSDLFYFRVQSEPISEDTICLWVAAQTANALKQILGSLERDRVSAAIIEALSGQHITPIPLKMSQEDLAVSIPISLEAHQILINSWDAVSDEHRAQLLLKALAND